MKKEKACGAVIIKDGKVLMVMETDGHWGLPKGHVELGETEIQTAIREVKEETNLDVVLDETKRYEINYITKDTKADKNVVYFVAKDVNGTIKKQDSEINKIEWVSLDKAVQVITYDNAKEMLKNVLLDEGYLA